MHLFNYTLRFTAPAFLGNAEQNAQWRTPPIKALLRQWWRVAYAAEHRFNVNIAAMRQEEGRLFGVAADIEGESRKSLVRIRLDKWAEGGLKKAQWPTDTAVSHPEVKNREGKLVPVGSHLYQGFGPLTYDSQRRTTTLKANAAIQFGESATLSLACPESHSDLITHALWLMDRYGALGGRSRNGWGSFALTPVQETAALAGTLPLRHWRDCLGLDWPHALGRDERDALIWETAAHDDWKALMKTLAVIKIGLRTQFKFPHAAPPHQDALPRHWLSYPITKHTTRAFPRDARLPNSLRFKVRPAPNDPQKLVGVILHVPCLPPAAFRPNNTAIMQVWQQVHNFLDAPVQKLHRIQE